MDDSVKAFLKHLDPVVAYAIGRGGFNNDSREYLEGKGLLQDGKPYFVGNSLGHVAESLLENEMMRQVYIMRITEAADEPQTIEEPSLASGMESLRLQAIARGEGK